MKPPVFLFLFLALSSTASIAKNFAPVPVWDVLGSTVPYQSTYPDEVKLWPADMEPQAHQIKPITYDEMIEQNLPIHTSIENRRFERYKDQRANHFIRPICIVGYDKLSIDWLTQHAEALASHGAVCLIAFASNLDNIKQLQQSAPGVVIQPTSASKLIQQLEIKSYPALIFNGWVAQ